MYTHRYIHIYEYIQIYTHIFNTTTGNQRTKQYIGMMFNAFKNQFRNHQKSFCDKKHQNQNSSGH